MTATILIDATKILKQLILLKKHKDEKGKDVYYEAVQPKVWAKAFKWLEQLPPSEPTEEEKQELLKCLRSETSPESGWKEAVEAEAVLEKHSVTNTGAYQVYPEKHKIIAAMLEYGNSRAEWARQQSEQGIAQLKGKIALREQKISQLEKKVGYLEFDLSTAELNAEGAKNHFESEIAQLKEQLKQLEK